MFKHSKKMVRGLALVVATILIVTTLMMGIPLIYGASDSHVYAAASDVTDEKSLEEELSFMAKVIEAMRDTYKDEISYEVLVNGAYKGLFESLNDPYSTYYENKVESDEFIEDASGEFDGVGISMENDQGRCRVVSPVANSPAEEAGLKSGDIIEKVNNVSLQGKTMGEWKSLIRGEAGTQVTLLVDRNGAKLTFTVTRARIHTTAVKYEMLDHNIGYLQVTRFDSDSDDEFYRARRNLLKEGATSLIVDVRNNPGGLVNAAANVANMLIPGKDKVIMQMTSQGEKIGELSTTGVGTELPVVLLINSGSASASEILAAALKDNKAATLVGTTTYGKGVAQTVTQLKNGGTMKLSNYYFTTPNGNEINHVGVAPDVHVENGLGLTEEEIATVYSKLAPMSELTKYYKGQTGLNVYAAQQRLNLLGENLKVTGTMDDATVAAIKKLQKATGMSPYGGLDYATMTALEKSLQDLLYGGDDDKQLEKAIQLLSK